MLVKRNSIYYGWWVVIAAAGTEFANAASAISILTLFVTPMTEEFGWNRTEIAGATSLGAALGAGIAPFSGRLVDRIGSRLLLSGGGAIVAVSCLYLSIAQTLIGFYVAFTLARISDQGLIRISSNTVGGKWFLRYRGRATAIVVFAGATGIIALAPVVQVVIDHWGWRTAWALLGVVMLLLGVVPSALLVRRRPEDLGLNVDGVSLQQEPLDKLAVARARATAEAEWSLRQALHTPTFWIVLVSLFIASVAGSGVGLHLVPHLTQQGLSSAQAVGAISIMSACSAGGSLLLGALAEKLSIRLLLFSMYLLYVVSMVVLTLADTLMETYLFAVFQGVASAGVNLLAPVLWVSYYGRATLGSIFGLSRAAQVTGFALGPLLSGIVYDATGSYQSAFVYFAIMAAISSGLVLAARQPALTTKQEGVVG